MGSEGACVRRAGVLTQSNAGAAVGGKAARPVDERVEWPTPGLLCSHVMRK